MKQAHGRLLSAFSCSQAFILKVYSVFLQVGFVGCLLSYLLWCLSCMFFKVAAEET